MVAGEVTRELRLSTTVTPVERAAKHSNTAFTDDFIDHLVQRSAATLTGAARVGALRAVGHAISRRRPHVKRREISELTRRYAREHSLIAINASLIADDAHAHLFAAERLRPRDDHARDAELLELRRVLTARGCQLLMSAFACAQQEPWNPFLQHRLFAEKQEHAETPVEAGLTPEPWQVVEAMAAELADRWRATTDEWRAVVDRRGDDIGAFFSFRKSAPSGGCLSGDAAALVEQEPDLVRYF